VRQGLHRASPREIAPAAGVSLPGNAILASNAFIKEQPQAVAAFLRAVTRAVKDAAAVALLKEFEPLIDVKIEALRLDVALDGEIATPTVRREGLGGIDVARYQAGIDSLARVPAFKSVPDAASLVDTRFLPAKAQRMVFA
jgi:NitT/TauT family transport system substrate-binding protein